MKHQQVVPDYLVMLESSITILALVGCGWLLFKLVSACIWFPQYMQRLEFDADKANAHFEAKLLKNLPDEPSTSADPESPKNDEDAPSLSKDDDKLDSGKKKKRAATEVDPENSEREAAALAAAADDEPKKDK